MHGDILGVAPYTDCSTHQALTHQKKQKQTQKRKRSKIKDMSETFRQRSGTRSQQSACSPTFKLTKPVAEADDDDRDRHAREHPSRRPVKAVRP